MFEVYDYYAEVKPKLVRKNQYEYYVPRYAVAAYEIGEIEVIYDWLPKDAYEELPPEEKKEYVFYKWTEPDSWYKTLAEVVERVEVRLVDYYRETAYCNDDFMEYLQPTNPVRLIVEIS